jgi:hypothetical protein
MAQDLVSLFISYSHKDEKMREELGPFLEHLKGDLFEEVWHDREIPAGAEWDEAILGKLQRSDVIVLLMSQQFIVSKYIRDNEVPAALARHLDGSAVVIPVVLSAFTWANSPLTLSKIQSVPRDYQDVESFADRKKAWKLVSEEIQAVAVQLRDKRRLLREKREAGRERYRAEVGMAMSDGHIDKIEDMALQDLQQDLQLSDAEARQLRDEAALPIQKKLEARKRYRRYLLAAIEDEWPLGEAYRNSLGDRKRALELTDAEVQAVESELLPQAAAIHHAARAAAEAAASPPPPPPAEPVVVAAPAAAPAAPTAPAAKTAAKPQEKSAPQSAPVRTDFGDTVLQLLQQAGKHSELFVAPAIPESKRKNAVAACKLPADDTVVGLVDFTIFGSATDACIFGRRRLYYHHDDGAPQNFVLPYAALAGQQFKRGEGNKILSVVLSGGKTLHWPSTFDATAAAALLSRLRDVVVQAVQGVAEQPSVPDDAAQPAAPGTGGSAYTVAKGPRFAAPADDEDVDALDELIIQALTLDLRRLIAHGVPGSLVVLEAAAAEQTVDVANLLVTETGDLLLGVEGNDDLPPALRLPPERQRALVDKMGMVEMEPPGWTHALSLGPLAGVDAADAALAVLQVLAQFGLPGPGLDLGWTRAMKKA